MVNTALITGASSGIGAAFARYHASKGGDLILTARRDAELQALKSELETSQGVTAHVFALDLGTDGGAQALYSRIKEAGLTVDILINNAGFGAQGRFLTHDLDSDLAMIDLNVKALMTLTHLVATDMVAQGSGKILNVGSTAGFMPGPWQATYFATKAFVNSFSQALSEELHGTNVTCTLLAPGYVETEFAKTANLEGTSLASQGGATSDSVAKHGYDAMVKGKLITINDRSLSFLVNWLLPILPRRFALGMVRKMQAKPK